MPIATSTASQRITTCDAISRRMRLQRKQFDSQFGATMTRIETLHGRLPADGIGRWLSLGAPRAGDPRNGRFEHTPGIGRDDTIQHRTATPSNSTATEWDNGTIQMAAELFRLGPAGTRRMLGVIARAMRVSA